jgi:hypothetical protein
MLFSRSDYKLRFTIMYGHGERLAKNQGSSFCVLAVGPSKPMVMGINGRSFFTPIGVPSLVVG